MATVPRAVTRAALILIALFDGGSLVLALHRPSVATLAAALLGPLFVVVPVVGAYVAARRPGNPLGWIFLAAGLALAVWCFAGAYGYLAFSEHEALPAAGFVAWLESWVWTWSVPLIAGFGILLFPDGRLPTRRSWAVAALAGLMLACLTFGLACKPEYFDWSRPNPGAAPWGLDSIADAVYGPALALMFPVSTLTALTLLGRTRRAHGDERSLLRLALFPAIGIAISYLGCGIVSSAGGNTIYVFAFECVAVIALAAGAAIGVVRYGLFDLRVVVNRAAVYAALTVIVIALYLGVSAAVGLLASDRPSEIAAGALVALAALPLRDRLQQWANRLLYGDRDDPYAAISRLSSRLDAIAQTTELLPTVVRTVSESLHLPYVAVELRGELTAVYGRPGAGVAHSLPLTFQGECIGALLCETRAPGERFAPADRRLLGELAHHVALAAREVLLTRDLVRSREELVVAREEERRRVRRDLHDGLGPSLAGIALGIDAARRSLRDDPEQADRELAELRTAAQESVVEIRRIAHDLRSPALDQLGLIGALRAQVERFGSRMEAPDDLPILSAAVETAAYRIALEALANAHRHADAGECRVRVSISDGLRVEVEDDGVGFAEPFEAGLGLSSIRERADELGGSLLVEPLLPRGTRVLAILPLSA
jgi:two-component system NarL family sensor kinase